MTFKIDKPLTVYIYNDLFYDVRKMLCAQYITTKS